LTSFQSGELECSENFELEYYQQYSYLGFCSWNCLIGFIYLD
jgi:hypothetical protein